MDLTIKIIVFSLFLVNIYGTGSAELYKYHDEAGVVCFTNDLSVVPVEQRQLSERIQEIQSDTSEDSAKKNSARESETVSMGLSDDDTGTDTGNQEELQKLEKLGNKLGKLHAELKSEYDTLQESDADMTEAQIEDYNLKVKALNEKNRTYQKEKKAYDERVRQFNNNL